MIIVFVFYTNIPLYLNKITDSYIAGSLNLLLLGLIVPFVLLRIRDAFGFLSTELAWWGIFVTAMYGLNVWRATHGDIVLLDDEMIDEVNRLQRQALMLGIMVVVYLSDPKVFYRCILLIAPVIPITIIVSFFAPELLHWQVLAVTLLYLGWCGGHLNFLALWYCSLDLDGYVFDVPARTFPKVSAGANCRCTDIFHPDTKGRGSSL